MKFKKTLISISSVAAIAAPIAAVVSCGSSSNFKVDKATPIFFVGDGGSLTDHTFNENSLNGAKQYVESVGGKWDSRQQQQPSDAALIPAGYKAALSAGAKVVVGAGFKHGDPAKAFYAANGLGKNQTFIGIDTDFTAENNNHLASIQFKTEQAGYLAGLYAVQYLNEQNDAYKTAHIGTNNKFQVATYGGQPFASVTTWMDGFKQGIEAGNSALVAGKTEVEMIYATGTTATAADFAGGFGGDAATTAATTLTKSYISKGADIIFPVAGPLVENTINEIKAQNKDIKVFGVDGDQYKALNNDLKPFVIGSALKGLQKASFDSLKAYFDSLDKDGNVGQSFIDEYVKKAHIGEIGFVFGNSSTDYTTATAKSAATIFDATKSASFDMTKALPTGVFSAAKF